MLQPVRRSKLIRQLRQKAELYILFHRQAALVLESALKVLDRVDRPNAWSELDQLCFQEAEREILYSDWRQR
jgi:hypothetical protein